MVNGRSVLVLTVVHNPHDGRIRARQIESLLAAGWQVTYAAPWSGHDLPVPRAGETPGLSCVDVPRASGRRRLVALRAARALLRERAAGHDVVLLHDPELLLALLGLRLPAVVWDVHEDTAAAVRLRAWLPRALRVPAAGLARTVERAAETRLTLLLADARYAARFTRTHLVVPNSTWVPDEPGPAAAREAGGAYRVVYLGSITLERGAAELVEVGRMLRERTDGAVTVEVMGPAHGRAEPLMQAAHRRGDLVWTGYLPNEEALSRVDGALAGLSLLHDKENFTPSMPTKIVEYLARGVPAITTPVPLAADLVTRADAGLVVPFGTVDEVATRVVDQVVAWADDPAVAVVAGRRGHALVRAEWNWSVHAAAFVDALEWVARRAVAS